MDVTEVGDRECIQCACCMDVCATHAISFKAGKWTIMDPYKGLSEKTADVKDAADPSSGQKDQ